MTLALAMRPVAAATERLVIGYLRESRASSRVRGMPPEQRAAVLDREMGGQKARIRDRVQHDGLDPDVIVWNVEDWNRSGGRGSYRPGLLRLQADMRAGRVGAVYAAALARFDRHPERFRDLWYAASNNGARLVAIDRATPLTDQSLAALQPSLASAEGESAAGIERAVNQGRPNRLNVIEVHREACSNPLCPETIHWDGQPPYGTQPGEDIGAVIEAYRQAQNYARAADALNVAGVPTRSALFGDVSARWWTMTVERIIGFAAINGLLDGLFPAATVTQIARRASAQRTYSRAYTQARHEARAQGLYLSDGRPDISRLPVHLLPARAGRSRRRHRPLARHAFAHLVRCPHHGDEDVRLTATWRTTRAGREVGLFCSRCREVRIGRGRAPRGANLPAYSVTERLVRGWVEAATASVLNMRVLSNEPDVAAQLGAIERRLSVLDDAHREGFVDEESYRRQQADIEAERAAITSAERASLAYRVGIDWTLPDAELNAALRDLIHSVELGLDFRPVAFVWTREPTYNFEEGDAEIEATATALAQITRVIGGWRIPWTAP